MLNLIYQYLVAVRPVVILAMTVLGLIAAGWAWFAPRHGSASHGLGKLFGLVIFLAVVAVLPTLVSLAQRDLSDGGPVLPGSTPQQQTGSEAGN